MLKILITGGAGFIGSNLIEKLLDKDTFIYCIDNLSTGSLYNIKNFIQKNNFEFINHDIINSIPHYDVDIIYNFPDNLIQHYFYRFKYGIKSNIYIFFFNI